MRATFPLAGMTFESLIFVEQQLLLICHQNVLGKQRVFHLLQELARPNSNKNIHFVSFHFCSRLALYYYYYYFIIGKVLCLIIFILEMEICLPYMCVCTFEGSLLGFIDMYVYDVCPEKVQPLLI